ncbi:MAG: hypothetical protein M1833_005549 [Piccolia ochrophora]|nr:MAG: hypothetical protein M1833_005549 [Piccolia ochrophora]
MSEPAKETSNQPEVDDDEPDEWDKRIFSTGCSDENVKMNDCYFDKKDWRLCSKELSLHLIGIHLVNSRHRRASTAPTANQANPSSPSSTSSQADLADGLSDQPLVLDESGQKIDWARSFHGLSTEPFSKEASDVLLKSIPSGDIEVKPDGIIYLPEIKYRRILNQAFGPGAWGLAPRGETIVTGKSVTREYALVVHGRLVSIARGEMDYFSSEGIPTAAEGCKSNALMRCCKDLGVASELWDPRFIRKFISQHAKEVWAEHVVSKKKRKLWVRKEDEVPYPYKESKGFGA